KLTAREPASVNIGNSRYVEQFERLFNFLEAAEDPQRTLDEIFEFFGCNLSSIKTYPISDNDSDKTNILKLAAKYLRDDIRANDYDTNTIDGKNTFYYTAGIETITPESSVGINLSIQRLKQLPPASAIANRFKVKIYDYAVPETRGLQQIKIKDVRALRTLGNNDTHLLPGEKLWTAGYYLKIPKNPGWSSFMELRTNSAIFDVTKIK
ncbi:hypothetical protein KQX54_000352, partial [Cotesia glomerata]